MTVQEKQQRDELKKKYPGEKWAAKVDKMSAAQVAATLYSINQRKKK